MSDSRAAVGFDRLPWLSDEPAPKPKPKPSRRAGRELGGWGAAAVLLVAGASFWLGTQSEAPRSEQRGRAAPSATVPLPQPRSEATRQVSIAERPQVAPAPVPEVRPAPAPEVRSAAQRPIRPAAAETRRVAAESRVESKPQRPTQAEATKTETPPAASAPVARPVPVKPWPPRVTAGAAGRLVQIGAFGSVHQAKRGWWYMVRTYPAMARLPAVVRPDRNSKGRIFYRFRVGTTSQAHSEVLCQRMQKIRFSCAVVGLPWKAKVER